MIYGLLVLGVIMTALSLLNLVELRNHGKLLEKIMADESATELEVDKIGTDVTTLLAGVTQAITTLSALNQTIADLKAHPATDDTAVQTKLAAIDTTVQNAMGQLTAALPQPAAPAPADQNAPSS